MWILEIGLGQKAHGVYGLLRSSLAGNGLQVVLAVGC